MDSLIHIANLLLLVSLCLKDILWLRLLNIAASCFFLAFFYTRPTPMWAAFGWNILFVSINLYQIWRLLLERRPVFLTEEEHRIHGQVFSMLSPRDFLTIVGQAERCSTTPGTRLIQRGEALDRLYLLTAGQLEVKLGDERMIQLGPGQFVGEMSFLTGSDACADVQSIEAIHYLVWSQQALQHLFAQRPALCSAMQQALGNDLARKLQG